MDQIAKKQSQDNKKEAITSFFRILGCTAFFACLFLYCCKAIRIDLIYQKFALDPWIVPFEPGLEFFKTFLDEPGRILSYIESFLFQWYYLNTSGSIIAVLVAMCAFLATYSLLTVFKVKGRYFLAYCPAIAFALTCNIYDNMLYNYAGLIIAVVFAVLYIIIAPKNRPVSILIFSILFASLYFMIAAFSLMFALLVLIYEAVPARRQATAITQALIACAVIILIGTIVCGIPIKEAFMQNLTFAPRPWACPFSINVFYAMCGLILLASLIFGTWHRLAPKPENENTHPRTLINTITAAIQLTVAVIICTVALFFSFEPSNKVNLLSKYYARQSMWDELIELGEKNPQLHKYLFFNHDHTRALFHTNRLESELFKYPQSIDALLLSVEDVQQSREYYEKAGAIMLELGYVNGTEINSFELLEGSGNWPLVLENLALINLAKGQDQTAMVFLNKLSKDILQGKQARQILQQIKNDPALLDNKRIRHLRSIAITEADLPTIGYDTDDFYLWLLRKNPKNKMAFQYMMAKSLLKEDTNKIAENIYRLDDLGYDKLPRYYEEALVIETQLNKDINIPEKWKPSAKAMQQGNAFLQTYAIYKKDKAKAMRVLTPEFGDSFYFYFMFN